MYHQMAYLYIRTFSTSYYWWYEICCSASTYISLLRLRYSAQLSCDNWICDNMYISTDTITQHRLTFNLTNFGKKAFFTKVPSHFKRYHKDVFSLSLWYLAETKYTSRLEFESIIFLFQSIFDSIISLFHKSITFRNLELVYKSKLTFLWFPNTFFISNPVAKGLTLKMV